MVGTLHSASEPPNGGFWDSKLGEAFLRFPFVLLLALIVGVPIWYLFSIDFFKVLVVALALATLYSLTRILDPGWFSTPLLMMMLGLIVAVPVWLVFSTGFFTVFAIFLVLGILIPLLEGEERRGEGRRSYEQGRTEAREKVREARELKARELKARELKARELKARELKAREREQQRQHQASLHELRAMPYEEYLHTSHLKRKREDKLRALGYRCQLCNRAASEALLEVHHRTYERLGEELDEDLTVLCRPCHSTFHEHRRLGH